MITLLQTMRPQFLILTVVCVFLGTGLAIANQLTVNITLLSLVLSGAILAHISVNMLNEYCDFKSGLDLLTNKTTFSGGSGALPCHPESAKQVLITAALALLVVIVIGVYLVFQSGLYLLPIGLIGLFIIVSYTQWINKHPTICLIAPGIGFGVLMITGTLYILGGELSLMAWYAAGTTFFVVNNLLLLNQYPDIEADTRSGRYHFPIAYGINNSNWMYAFFTLASVTVILIGIMQSSLPMLSMIALLPVAFSVYALSGAVKHQEKIGNHPKYLAGNAAAAMLTPFLLGVSVIYG